MSNYIHFGDDAVVDFDRGRSYFKGEILVCCDCGKQKPFMAYEGGTQHIEGETYHYEICKGCVEESHKKAWEENRKPMLVPDPAGAVDA